MAGEWRPFRGVAWRVEDRDYGGKPVSAEHSAARAGRWHRVGQECLYLNADRTAVVANVRAAVLRGAWMRPAALAANVLDGGELGLAFVREIGVIADGLACADVRTGSPAVSWGLPPTYPLRSGAVPGAARDGDRVVPHAHCHIVADQVRRHAVGPPGIYCPSAALNGHAHAAGAEEVCALGPVDRSRFESRIVRDYQSWAELAGVDPARFNHVG